MAAKLLQFIGKGQITIPQEWRAVLGMEEKAVQASLEGNRIVIEPLPPKEKKIWQVEWISLNTLPKEDQKTIREGRKAYRNGKARKFLTAQEFFAR